MICKVSPFFRAACSKEWLEGQTRVVRLPLQEPEIFRYYVEWAYQTLIKLEDLREDLREIEAAKGNKIDDVKLQKTYARRFADARCKLWVAADYFGDQACQNACIQQLAYTLRFTKMAKLWTSTVDFVIEYTSPDSGLYRWMIDDLAHYLTNSPSIGEQSRWREKLPDSVKDQLINKGFAALKKTGSKLANAGEDPNMYLEKEI